MASRSPVRASASGTGNALPPSPRSRSPARGAPPSPRTHARPSSPTIRASATNPSSPRNATGASGTGRNRSPSPTSPQYRPTAKALTMSALRRAVSPPPTRGFKGTQTEKSENEPTDILYQTPSSPARRNPQDTRPPPILRHPRPSSPASHLHATAAAADKSQPPSFASAPGDFSGPSFDISVNPTSVILALEPGRRTPPTKRILQKLTSATNVLKQGGRISPRSASSSDGDEDDELMNRHVLGNQADAERTLANVLDVLEGVFDVTLVASDKSINIKDLESRLLAWKRKHLASAARVSLVDRVAPPPASPTALTSDLLDTRKLLASERHRAEALTSELNAVRAHLAQQKQHWRDRDATQAAEISRLKADVDRYRTQLNAASSELWTELEHVKGELDERTRAGHEQAAALATQRTELERAVQRVHELEAQDEQVNQDLDRVHHELTQAVGEKQALESELHEIRAELERVMADVARGNEQVRRTTASARDATQAHIQLERVQAEVVEVERRAREAEAHLASTRRELDVVRKQLGEANGREEEARGRAGESERARRGMEAQLAELEDKVHALKSAGRKRDEDLHAARKLLADRDRELKDVADKYKTIVGERDQLAVLRRDLQQQVDKLRTDHDRVVNMDRKLKHELDETRAQLREARETGAELKRHVDLLQTTKQGAERTVAEYENKCKHWEVQVRKTEDELAHARKEIETVTLQRINMEERVDKLQAKLHQFSLRAEEHKRELQGARSVAEARANELDTLQLKWKQVLTENKDLDHRVRSLEARVEQAHADRDSLAKQLSSESKTFKDKLSAALANAQELDKQLVEAKTQAQLALGERDRLISDNKKLLGKIEKYAERMNQADGRAAKAVEEKNKYERKTRELAKYKTLYQNVLEAGLLVDRPQLGNGGGHGAGRRGSMASSGADSSSRHGGGGAGVDIDLLTEHQQLLSRCRRIVQSAARYTSLSGSDSLSPDNLSTTEDLLEALEVVFSRLCSEVSHANGGNRSSSGAYNGHGGGSGNKSGTGGKHDAAALTDALLHIHRQCVSAASKIRNTANELVSNRLLDDDEIKDLELASRSLDEAISPDTHRRRTSLSPARRQSGSSGSAFADSATGLHSSTSTGGELTASPMSVAQAVGSLVKALSTVASSAGGQLLSKYKAVVVQIQDKVEQELRALERQVDTLRQDNSMLKDKLARTSHLTDKMMAARHRERERDRGRVD